MRSRRGFFASIVFLLALPLTALYQRVLGTGAESMERSLSALP